MYRWQAARESVVFEDRREAGRALAAALQERGRSFSAVLGLTRGGVVVAAEVASALHIPLDIIVVKKLRSPVSEELAIGAVCGDGTHVLYRENIERLRVTEEYLERELRERAQEAREAEAAYRGVYPPLDLSDGAAVVVDDGVATGSTMEAAVLSARKRGARTVTVAVPVGAQEACQRLLGIADEVVCLHTPPEFWAVGQFYRDFLQVSDEEVRRVLEKARASRKEGMV
jgi:putative phosphoribosyl transferase